MVFLVVLLAQEIVLKVLNRKKDWDDIAKIKQKILESNVKKSAVIIRGYSIAPTGCRCTTVPLYCDRGT
jgi:hypothetical protein